MCACKISVCSLGRTDKWQLFSASTWWLVEKIYVPNHPKRTGTFQAFLLASDSSLSTFTNCMNRAHESLIQNAKQALTCHPEGHHKQLSCVSNCFEHMIHSSQVCANLVIIQCSWQHCMKRHCLKTHHNTIYVHNFNISSQRKMETRTFHSLLGSNTFTSVKLLIPQGSKHASGFPCHSTIVCIV